MVFEVVKLKVISSFIFMVTLIMFALMWGPTGSIFKLEDTESIFYLLKEFRSVKVLMAITAGSALGVSGYILQRWFFNPLAGPFILGVQSGSSLAISLWLGFSSFLGFSGFLIEEIGRYTVSILGGIASLLIVLLASRFSQSKYIVIIVGVLISFIASGISSTIMIFIKPEVYRTLLFWNLGDLSNLSFNHSIIFFITVICLIISGFYLLKELEICSLGDSYAVSMGVNLKRLAYKVYLIVGLLSGIVTAVCGPVVLVGVISPHLAKIILGSRNYTEYYFTSALMGCFLMLLTIILQAFTGGISLPANTILGMIAGPILLILVIKSAKRNPSNV